MKPVKLAGLAPENVFYYFEQLCAIPHGSGNTRQISDYFVSFARENDLRYIQDDADNVIIFKPASPGYENHEPVILQSHMDMVCQIDEGSGIDMAATPLDVTHDGTYVYARRTSLGADDGAGVALALAVLADKNAVHPPLEVVFTSGEETGMIGAKAIDLSMLRGKRLLNMDTLSEGAFTAGCAGSARVTLTVPVAFAPVETRPVTVCLTGLRGGHSGSSIKFGYQNANRCMAQLVGQLGCGLVRLQGGMSGNAIPRSCTAVIQCPEDMTQAEGICESFVRELREKGETDAAVTLEVGEKSLCQSLSPEDTRRVTDFVLSLPNGVQTWDPRFEDLPQTSLNLGILTLDRDLQVMYHIRSSVNGERQGLQDLLAQAVAQVGGVYADTGVYSAWEYRPESPFRSKLMEVYEQVYGKTPKMSVIHAGLECGIFSEKIQGLDCVSAGPTALYIHTNREKLDVASMGRFYRYLQEALKQL